MNESAFGLRLRDYFLTADRRVLALTRIVFGLVLLYDLARRWRVIDLFYTNDGVLSNHFVLYQPQSRPQLSLLMTVSTLGEAHVAFAIIGFVYALYTLGLFTRVAQILTLISITSLNARNLFLEDGGVSVMIALAAWSSFMPFGDRFSIDAVVRDARLSDIRARVAARAKARAPFVSLAVLGLTLQIVAIYLLSGLHKTGSTWRHGEAVHYILWQNRVGTPFAWWLAHHEPPWLSPLTTRATLAIEYAIPALLLVPFARVSRIVAFFAAVALHGGIALVMTLGPFSYAMMALVVSQLPGESIAWCAARVPRKLGRRAARLRARAVRWLADRVPESPRRGPKRPFPWARAREATVACALLTVTLEISNANRAIKLKIPEPQWLHDLVYYLRMAQTWSMYAPDGPDDDGYGVVDAVTADGRHFDPFLEGPPDYSLLDRGPSPEKIEVADYLFSIQLDRNQPYRHELARYLDHWHERDGRTPNDRIVGYDVWWIWRKSPRLGSMQPGPTERVLVTSGSADR